MSRVMTRYGEFYGWSTQVKWYIFNKFYTIGLQTKIHSFELYNDWRCTSSLWCMAFEVPGLFQNCWNRNYQLVYLWAFEFWDSRRDAFVQVRTSKSVKEFYWLSPDTKKYNETIPSSLGILIIIQIERIFMF